MTKLLRTSEVCARVGVTRKALRGYEDAGLVAPRRDANGYRTYDEHQVRATREVRRLNALGIPLAQLRPFVDCLDAGAGDSCPATLAEYRRAIERVDETVAALSERRDTLVRRLSVASRRAMGEIAQADAANPFTVLPDGLPAPVDDGATDQLPGRRLPAVSLPSTDGGVVDASDLGRGRVLLYLFPMTGSPDRDLPDGWDAIPGARGCTPQSCDMRDHYAELVQHGVHRVFGLSSQPAEYQLGLVNGLRLPYPLLTDDALALADDPGLPTFEAGGLRLYRRQTLLLLDGVIERVFYPVFPPNEHAQTVLSWLAQHPLAR